MLEIKKNITTVNRKLMNNKQNKYIVIHYVGAISSAHNNTIYFKNQYRGASAHYFVDDNNIYQCVEDKDASWHCGALVYYSQCRNTNSIGIEMCCYNNNGILDISEKTVNNTIELTKHLMKKYNIPINNVLRHYDVTRKNCPAPFVKDFSRWETFKSKLLDESIKKEENFVPYLVKITANILNVRAGAGTNYRVTTTVRKNQVYTIVGEKMNGNTKWLQLKSGSGYISASYTKKI